MFTQLWSIGAGGIDWPFPFLGNFLRTHSYLDLFSSFLSPPIPRLAEAQSEETSSTKLKQLLQQQKRYIFYLVRMRWWQGLGGEWPKSTSFLLSKMEIFWSEIGSLEPGGNAVWWPGIKISEQPQAYLFPISLHSAPIYRQVSKKTQNQGELLSSLFSTSQSGLCIACNINIK